jgi:hypothetical protein
MVARPSLQICRFQCGHPDLFRTVRDFGRIFARCSHESEVSEDSSLRWLPAWLPGGKVHSSGDRRSEWPDCGADLPDILRCERSAKIVPSMS